jgi:hypothetical protein
VAWFDAAPGQGMCTDVPRLTTCGIEPKGAPGPPGIAEIIMAHNFRVVKEMYRDMFAATFRLLVSSRRSSTADIPSKWWHTAPEIDSWDRFTTIRTLLLLPAGHVWNVASRDARPRWWAPLDPGVRYVWRKYPSNGADEHSGAMGRP